MREEEPQVSKRHTASRRRTYGRRQHELHERLERSPERSREDDSWAEARGFGSEPEAYVDEAARRTYGYFD
jgi:hypothetical protein